MSLKKLLVLFCLSGFYAPVIAASYSAITFAKTTGAEFDSCSVFSEADKKDESTEGGAEEEEPDCE